MTKHTLAATLALAASFLFAPVADAASRNVSGSAKAKATSSSAKSKATSGADKSRATSSAAKTRANSRR